MPIVAGHDPLNWSMQIAVTYRCNSACKWCVQHLDKIRWQVDTDITAEEIRTAARLLKHYGIRINKLRITGGEPLVHPGLRQILEVVNETWAPRSGWFRIYSNGKLPRLRGVPGRFSVVPVDSAKKTDAFTPFNVSPADLGIEPKFGFIRPCVQQLYCGRWFDCFGFTSCGVAGVLGAMLGEDTYEPLPVMMGRPSVCQHCLYSLSKKERHAITYRVKAGDIPDVTKTFERAIERWHDDPPHPRRFWDRLPTEYLLPGEHDDHEDRSETTFDHHENGSTLLAFVPVQSV